MKLNQKKRKGGPLSKQGSEFALYCEEFAFLCKYVTRSGCSGPAACKWEKRSSQSCLSVSCVWLKDLLLLPFCWKLPDFHVYGSTFPLLPPHLPLPLLSKGLCGLCQLELPPGLHGLIFGPLRLHKLCFACSPFSRL